MRRRPHPDLVLALVAIAAVLALHAAARFLEPPLVALADAKEGARVAVEAYVTDARAGARSWRLMLADGHHRMPAFAPLRAPLERGDLVRAEGTVARDGEGLVLSIEEARVLVPTARVVREPADVAARPWAFDGARVVLAGEMRAGQMLAGGGARVRLAGEGAPGEDAGDIVATGVFRYHEKDASFVLWVASWTPR